MFFFIAYTSISIQENFDLFIFEHEQKFFLKYSQYREYQYHISTCEKQSVEKVNNTLFSFHFNINKKILFALQKVSSYFI